MSDAPRTPAPWAAGALIALTGINLFNYLDRQILPAVLTPVKEKLHLTDGQLGNAATAFMLGYFVTAPVFGYLGDRFSRKWLIAAGVLVWSLGTVFSGRAHGYGELILFRVLVGLGEASYGTISPAWIADLYAPARRNLALSVFYVAIPVGSALGYLFGGIVAAHWGWRAAFYGAGVPGFLLAVALLALREPARGASEARSAGRADPPGPPGIPPAQSKSPISPNVVPDSRPWWVTSLGAYAELRRFPAYLRVVAGYAAQTFALGAFAFWGPTFLHRVHGMPLEGADRFFGLALVVTGLGATLLGGWLGSAWQRRSPAGYAALLAWSALAAFPAVAAAFLLLDPGQAKIALVAAMFLIFLGTGPVNTLILETVPVGMRASAMAASIFAIHLFGDLWSPKIVGMLSDRCGNLQSAMLWTMPGAMLVCAIFWGWLAISYFRPAKT